MILVTGATGTVGSAVCRELAAEPVRVRAAVRTPDRFDGVADEIVQFDFTEPTTYRETFAGVDAMFLVRPPALSRVRRDIVPALAAAVGAGVDHVVFLSVIGADRNPLVPHSRIESWLERSGIETTSLRASFFMQNLLTEHRAEIEAGKLRVPAGRGATSFVDARDVAAVGATALTEPLTGAYDLTGPAALSYAEVARILSRELDHEVRYAEPSIPQFVYQRYRTDRDIRKVVVMAGIYTTTRLGLADRVTGEITRILGREPRDFETFVQEHRSEWQISTGTKPSH